MKIRQDIDGKRLIHVLDDNDNVLISCDQQIAINALKLKSGTAEKAFKKMTKKFVKSQPDAVEFLRKNIFSE